MNKMNTPNKLTILRMVMIPFFVVSFFLEFMNPWNRIIATAIFIIAALTDVLDGYLARKNGQVTDFGKFMDPLADKLLVFSALVSILVMVTSKNDGSQAHKIFYILIFVATMVVIAREFLVTSLRLICASSENKVVIAADRLGKTKTGLQDLFIIFALIGNVFVPDKAYMIVCYCLMIPMIILTIWSGINYLVKYKDYISTNK